MKLLEAIEIVAKTPETIKLTALDRDAVAKVNAANQFLYGVYGEKHAASEKAVTPATQKLIEKLGLTGDDFAYVGMGGSATVYGNEHVVFRLQKNRKDYPEADIVPLKKIPPGLASEILHDGTCNHVGYRVSERLNQERPITLNEMIPFVFKARDAGVMHIDLAADNMGYNAKGELLTVDHKHFRWLDPEQNRFRGSLKEVLINYPAEFPALISDAHNTYVILGKEESKSAVTKAVQKKIMASLNAVGITQDQWEEISDPPIIRIQKTEITYGTPPQTQKLTEYLEKGLGATLHTSRNADKAEEFIGRMTLVFIVAGGDHKALGSANELAAMDEKEFETYHQNAVKALKEANCKPEHLEMISKQFSDYAKHAYSQQQNEGRV